MREEELFESTMPTLGVTTREHNLGRWTIEDADPLSARCEFTRDYSIDRDSVHGRAVCWAEMHATPTTFVVSERFEVFESDERIHHLERSYEIPRRLA